MEENSVAIRVATPADAQALRDIYAPYVKNTAITFEYEVPSVPEFTERLRTVSERYPYLVAEADGEVLGFTYGSAFVGRRAYDWSVETSIYVKQYMRKKGVGRALYRALEQVLIAQGFTNMNACISYPKGGVDDEFLTTNSVGFHEHLGFEMVGRFNQCAYKFGRWYDMVWMERMIAEHRENQPEVIPFSQIADSVPQILAQ
ncbi:MAG: GNAT family N-acetyltransferase [Eggerthellaceae bacterium]|jgi:L-amino acid N-acyltransferase YncA